MSSQNITQSPKNWRFALKKHFLRLRPVLVALLAIAGMLVEAEVLRIPPSVQVLLYGAIIALTIVLLIEAEKAEARAMRMQKILGQYAGINHPIGDQAREALKDE